MNYSPCHQRSIDPCGGGCQAKGAVSAVTLIEDHGLNAKTLGGLHGKGHGRLRGNASRQNHDGRFAFSSCVAISAIASSPVTDGIGFAVSKHQY